MRFLKVLLLSAIIVLVIFIFVEGNAMNEDTEIPARQTIKEKESRIETKVAPETLPNSELEVTNWIGKSSEEIVESFGEPTRKDPSAYGYMWWVYNDDDKVYIQFGVEDGKIVTVFATGNNLVDGILQVGQSYEEVTARFKIEEEITYTQGLGSFTFRLATEDIKTRPLIKVDNNIFMQLYFDTFTQQLSSIRVLDGDTLLKHRPYEIVYRGSLPEEIRFTEDEWLEIETGMEKQIFDLTNVYRDIHDMTPLKWDDEVSNVAFQHSKDMAENDYFSHYALNGDGLKERLAKEEVYYIAAGENIAAQYTDAIAAMEGWLNSEGHRVALLSDEYTHLGVGVYRLYYTQNFLAKAN